MATPKLFHFFLVILSLLVSAAAKKTSLEPHQVEEDTTISRFRQYLRFNTAHPNPNYAAPVSFLTSVALSIGLQVKTFEFVPGKPVLLLTWKGSNPSLPSVLFNSHLDSVPAEEDKWSHPPFSAFHSPEDGKIYARGAQDDKCIGIQYLEAIRNLKASGFKPLRTVHVSYVPDEEIGGFDGSAEFVKSKEFEALNLGLVLDEGQASPTDEFRVFYADRSPWHLIIRAIGAPGHGSRLYDNTAMENLMQSVEIITKFRETQFDVAKAGHAALSEGFVMNMQPSEAEAGFDVRLPPTVDPNLMREKISKEWAPASRNMTYEIIEKGPLRDYKGRPLMTATDDSNPWWSVFEQAIIAAGGKLKKPEILASTTDTRFMRQMGIPAFGFSPMTNTPILLHDHDEFLKDTVFLRGIKVYEFVISSLSSFEEASQQKL
ncbi:aminoacylase-1 isoform X2 [Tripterygium wilfordii]|uniref:aminoacylase-1 isoform X2 n=1 Tax=Tripterygium wilfordii TaxID=458696 RepID=UPI0018F83DB8|nr:aminoacylase-1 isoform X2 [Tripterygium wilfordii]